MAGSRAPGSRPRARRAPPRRQPRSTPASRLPRSAPRWAAAGDQWPDHLIFLPACPCCVCHTGRSEHCASRFRHIAFLLMNGFVSTRTEKECRDACLLALMAGRHAGPSGVWDRGAGGGGVRRAGGRRGRLRRRAECGLRRAGGRHRVWHPGRLRLCCHAGSGCAGRRGLRSRRRRIPRPGRCDRLRRHGAGPGVWRCVWGPAGGGDGRVCAAGPALHLWTFRPGCRAGRSRPNRLRAGRRPDGIPGAGEHLPWHGTTRLRPRQLHLLRPGVLCWGLLGSKHTHLVASAVWRLRTPGSCSTSQHAKALVS